jgi:hypothetical protein
MKPHRIFLLIAACLFAALTPARAQITVEIHLKERLYILHEAVLATVTITNQTGRDITLADTPQGQWFSFQITGEGDHFIAPRNPDYHLPPLDVRAGESLKRTVNLNELYALGDYGIYSVRANIFYAPVDKYFSSKPTHIELTEGRVMWRQSAGVPDGAKGAGQTHLFTVLAHQRGEQNLLYVRVEDKDNGTVFCTSPLGRMIDGVPPQMQFDSANNLYVLQLIGQKAYVLSKIGVNGEFVGQSHYSAPKTRPYLRKQADGALQLVGGVRENPIAQAPADGQPLPKLSDRPAGLPGH